MKQIIFCSGVRVNEVSLRYNHPKKRKLPNVSSSNEAEAILRQCFESDRIAYKEFFFAMYLSRSNEVLALSCVGVGTEVATPVSIKEVVSNALLLNAHGVIVAHNHPSGNTMFSSEDLRITKQLKQALELFNLHLIDHFIFTKKNAVSLYSEEPEFFDS